MKLLAVLLQIYCAVASGIGISICTVAGNETLVVLCIVFIMMVFPLLRAIILPCLSKLDSF